MGQPRRAAVGLLSLPSEILTLILGMVGNADLLQNVQLTCMVLRQLMKRPGPGTYGKLKVLPKRHLSESMQFCAFRQLSEWLIMRAAGIDVVIISGDVVVSTGETLFFWLLGRHSDVMFGLHMDVERGRFEIPQSQKIMGPKLGSQLVSLEVRTLTDIWSMLFGLQALQHLRLCAHHMGDGSVPKIPSDRKLPCLETLELLDCTANTLPLTFGASLPKLRNLDVSRSDKARLQCTVSLDWPTFAGLEELHINDCSLNVCQVPSSAPLPAPSLRKLTMAGNNRIVLRDMLQWATHLSDVTTIDCHSAIVADLACAIEHFPALMRYAYYGACLGSDDAFHLGIIEMAMLERGGKLLCQFD